MADDLPPLPADAYDTPEAAAAAAAKAAAGQQPAVPPPPPALVPGGAVTNLPPLPADAYATPEAATAAAAPPPKVAPYSGSVLPFSTDDQGKIHFDPTAGVLGNFFHAVTAPGRVLEGTLPTPYSNSTGAVDPGTLGEARNFASFFGETSPATLAGEQVPGTLGRQAPPTTAQLKMAADTQYAAARASGMDVSGGAVSNAVNDLINKNTILQAATPKTYSYLDALANPPQGGFATVDGLLAARSKLSDLRLDPDASEARAASIAVHGIDDFLANLKSGDLQRTATGVTPQPNPQAVAQIMKDAAGNYAAAQRSNDVTGVLNKAVTGIGERAEGQAEATDSSNIGSSIRRRVGNFLQSPSNLTGFSEDEINALKAVRDGGAVPSALGTLSSLLGNRITGYLLGHLTGTEYGGEAGFMLAPIIKKPLQAIENWWARNKLNTADETIRSNSPLANSGFSNWQPTPNLYWRFAPPSLLSNRPPATQRPQYGLPPLPQQGPIPQSLLDQGWG